MDYTWGRRIASWTKPDLKNKDWPLFWVQYSPQKTKTCVHQCTPLNPTSSNLKFVCRRDYQSGWATCWLPLSLILSCHQTWFKTNVLSVFMWVEKQRYPVCHFRPGANHRASLKVWTGCFPIWSLCGTCEPFGQSTDSKRSDSDHTQGVSYCTGSFGASCCCWDSLSCAPVCS